MVNGSQVMISRLMSVGRGGRKRGWKASLGGSKWRSLRIRERPRGVEDLRRLSASEPRTRQRVRINSNLGFGLLPGRSDGSTASEAMDVLLFLLSWLENLLRVVLASILACPG